MLKFKATTPGPPGISAPSHALLFHCYMALSHAVTGRRDHPDTGQWVCDGLIQMYTGIAMKQHVWEAADMP